MSKFVSLYDVRLELPILWSTNATILLGVDLAFLWGRGEQLYSFYVRFTNDLHSLWPGFANYCSRYVLIDNILKGGHGTACCSFGPLNLMIHLPQGSNNNKQP